MKEHNNSNASQMEYTSFAPFQRLPLELRRQIWYYAIPSGVYIEFHHDATYASKRSQHIIARCSDHAVPPILHVNTEARAIALERLHLLGTGSSRIYFNPAVDTLMLGMLFKVNFDVLFKSPATILGENARLVRHIAYHQQRHNGGSKWPLFLEGFSASITSLDLIEWDALLTTLPAMRAALRSSVFREEDLVRVDEEEMRVFKFVWDAYLEPVERVWKELSDRPLDIKVMRLPTPLWKIEERFKMEKLNAKLKADKKADNGGFSSWRYLGGLFAKVGFGEGPKENRREAPDWYDIGRYGNR